MILSEQNFEEVVRDVELLKQFFKDPPEMDFDYAGSGPQTPNQDSFAFTSQVDKVKNMIQDAVYKMERGYGQFSAKVENSVANFKQKIDDFEERLMIKKSDTPLEINEEWHAELTQDALSSVDKL